jgi:alcohol dehydrogenase class IV
VLRFTGAVHPARHLDAARWLGADVRGAGPVDAGEVVAAHLVGLMRDLGMPNGVGGVGYGEQHVKALVEGTLPQARLLSNAPREATREVLEGLFRNALGYW